MRGFRFRWPCLGLWHGFAWYSYLYSHWPAGHCYRKMMALLHDLHILLPWEPTRPCGSMLAKVMKGFLMTCGCITTCWTFGPWLVCSQFLLHAKHMLQWQTQLAICGFMEDKTVKLSSRICGNCQRTHGPSSQIALCRLGAAILRCGTPGTERSGFMVVLMVLLDKTFGSLTRSQATGSVLTAATSLLHGHIMSLHWMKSIKSFGFMVDTMEVLGLLHRMYWGHSLLAASVCVCGCFLPTLYYMICITIKSFDKYSEKP